MQKQLELIQETNSQDLPTSVLDPKTMDQIVDLIMQAILAVIKKSKENSDDQ
jgi:hypothetical protein